jgi:hypothetical protein
LGRVSLFFEDIASNHLNIFSNFQVKIEFYFGVGGFQGKFVGWGANASLRFGM